MGLSQTEIARLWLWSLLVGGALGAVYDCLRLTRLLPGGVPPVAAAKQLVFRKLTGTYFFRRK